MSDTFAVSQYFFLKMSSGSNWGWEIGIRFFMGI